MNGNDRTELATETRAGGMGVERATGRGRAEWFALLDTWGAVGRPYREIADWLTGEHGLSTWWAQKLIVEYEESRGVRPPGVRRDGTFEVGASKTVAASAEQLLAACVDPAIRERWLPDAAMHERAIGPGRQARFDWGDDGSRVTFTVTSLGSGKTRLDVLHERIADAGTAEATKVFWRERISELKLMLEA